MPVISCRFPMSRKAASSVVSSGSTTTRPPGSSARYSGSRVDRCAVSTTDSPRSSSARAVCDPMEPRPPVMRIASRHDRDARPGPVAALVRNGHPRVGASGRRTRRGRARRRTQRRLREELAGRHAQEPAALAAEVCLVVVPGLDGPPCEIDVRGALLGDRRLDAGDEALETQDAVQLLRADADRGPAPAPQLAFGDRQQRGQSGRSAAAPRHEVPDGLVHQRVRFAGGSRDERLEPIERDPRRRGFPEKIRQAGQVAPDVGARDVLVDQLVGRHPDETAEHARTQPHPDDRASRRDLLVRRRGQGPEQPGRLTEHTSHLGAAVWHVPLRHGPVAHLLDPDGRRERGERRRRRALHVGRFPGHPTILPTRLWIRNLRIALPGSAFR